MRKFSHDENGRPMPTSTFVSKCRQVCAQYGIGSVGAGSSGPFFGYLVILAEEAFDKVASLERRIAEIEKALASTNAKPADAPKVEAGTLPGQAIAWREMNAEQRAAYRAQQQKG